MKYFIGVLLLTIAILFGYYLRLVSEEKAALPPPAVVELDPGGLPQRVRAIALEGDFDFAGERIPTENFDVRERLDLELTRNAYFHRHTLMLLKRRNRFFPTIERILEEEGVPQDMKYLAAAESALTNAKSPAGARGVWQFMPSTARAYGLRVDGEVDERLHLEKSTRAAADYLSDYYKQFGSWHSVAAAYNMGGPNLSKWMKRQNAETVFDLDINQETMQYLFRIVAIKSIMQRPESFGFELSEGAAYPPLDGYREVNVDKKIVDLATFAREQGTTYRLLKVYNPWLVSGSFTPRGGATIIKIPTAK